MGLTGRLLYVSELCPQCNREKDSGHTKKLETLWEMRHKQPQLKAILFIHLMFVSADTIKSQLPGEDKAQNENIKN